MVGSGDTDLTPGPPRFNQVKPTHAQIKVVSSTFSSNLNCALEEDRVLKGLLILSFLSPTNGHENRIVLGTGNIQ